MGLKIIKGVNMTKEQQSIIDELEVLYGVNWWDESDYSERG